MTTYYNHETHSWEIENSEVIHQFQDPTPGSITLSATGNDEMLRVAADGFYVRGVRVPADAQEAETVYNAFKQWLAWANLQQQ